jgi:hypothetical protein
MPTISKSTVFLGIVTVSLLASLAGSAVGTSEVRRSAAKHVQDADAVVLARITAVQRNGHLSRRFEATGERDGARADSSRDIWSDVIMLEVAEVLKSTSPIVKEIRVEWPDYGWDSRSWLDSWESGSAPLDVNRVWFLNNKRPGVFELECGPLPADTLEHVRRCVRAIDTRYAHVPPGLPADGAWAISFGSSVSDIAVDDDGGVVVAGRLRDDLFLRGDRVWTATDYWGVCLARFSRDGALKWVRGFDADGGTSIGGIEIDKTGQIFVTGTYYDERDFGDFRMPDGDVGGAFVARYGPTGKFRGQTPLVCRFEGHGIAITSMAMCLSPRGTYVIAGNYRGSIEAGERRITARDDHDIFICEVGPDGDILLLKGIETREWESVSEVAVTGSGAIVLGGARRESSGLSEAEASELPYLAQVIRCTPAGEVVKRWHWGDRWSVTFEDMAILPGGDIVVSVGIPSTMTTISEMRDGISVEESSSPLLKSHLYRWSPDGELRWKKPGGGSVVLVDRRDIVCAGWTHDFTMNHEGLPPSRGDADVYVKRYSANGELLWSARDGGMGQEILQHGVINGGRLVIAGSHQGMSHLAGEVLDPIEKLFSSAYIASVPIDGKVRRTGVRTRR